MFCQLGYVAFERREYLEAMESTHKYEFAQHAHVEGKPGLQAIGDALDVFVLDMVFHHTWCDPAASIDKLKEVAGRKEAQALIWGDGTYYGRFVVTELVRTFKHESPAGELLFAVLRINLLEHVDPEPLVTKKKAAVAKAPGVKAPARPGKAPAPKPGVKAKSGTPPFVRPTSTRYNEVPTAEIARS